MTDVGIQNDFPPKPDRHTKHLKIINHAIGPQSLKEEKFAKPHYLTLHLLRKNRVISEFD